MPPVSSHVRLDDARRLPSSSARGKFQCVCMALAGGDWDVRSNAAAPPSRPRLPVAPVPSRKNGFERLEHLDDAASRGDVPLSVRFHVDCQTTDRLRGFRESFPVPRSESSSKAGDRGRDTDQMGSYLPAVAPCSIKFLGALPVRIGRARDLAPAITGVNPQPVVNLCRPAACRPARSASCRGCPTARCRSRSSPQKRAAQSVLFEDVHAPPELLDVPGALSYQHLLEGPNLGNHRLDIRGRSALAPAVNAFGGFRSARRRCRCGGRSSTRALPRSES